MSSNVEAKSEAAANVELDATLHPDAWAGDDGKVTIQQPLGDKLRRTDVDVLSRPVWCPVISVDDHLLEPPTLFDRVPAKYRDDAPKLVEVNGHWGWEFGNVRRLMMAVDTATGGQGREGDEVAGHRDEYRPGVYDVDARVRDMDLNGVWASMNFPSSTWGFCGTAFSRLPDPEVGLACVRAFNDWHIEDWCGAHPDRFIACQLPLLSDPVATAAEIRRNAARGVRALSFSENPYHLGYPTLYSDFWEPVWKACADTDTVINIHVGSSGKICKPSPDSAVATGAILFAVNSIEAVIEWIFAKIPVRFPTLKVVLSEGGVSWVPTMYERLGHAFRRREEMSSWDFNDPHPSEILRRNFWFTSIDDPSAFRLLDIIGEDRVMLEVDYPHPDSTWPDTQELVREELVHLSTPVVRKLCYENAAALYGHPAPPVGFFESTITPV